MKDLQLIICAILVAMYLFSCENKADEVTPQSSQPSIVDTILTDTTSNQTDSCGEITFYSSDSCKIVNLTLTAESNFNRTITRLISNANKDFFPVAVNGDTSLVLLDSTEYSDSAFYLHKHTFPNGITQKIPYLNFGGGNGIFVSGMTSFGMSKTNNYYNEQVIAYGGRYIQNSTEGFAFYEINRDYGFEFKQPDSIAYVKEFKVIHYDLTMPIKSYEITYKWGSYNPFDKTFFYY